MTLADLLDSWELIALISVIGSHMVMMWKRTNVANDHLSKMGAVAGVLMAEDPNAKIPNTPYMLSLINQFHESLDRLEDIDGKVNLIVAHLGITTTGAVAKRRINHE